LKPPNPNATGIPIEETQETSDLDLDYWTGMTGFENYEHPVAAPQNTMEDLLGLDDSPPPVPGPVVPASKIDASVDLLGLDF